MHCQPPEKLALPTSKVKFLLFHVSILNIYFLSILICLLNLSNLTVDGNRQSS